MAFLDEENNVKASSNDDDDDDDDEVDNNNNNNNNNNSDEDGNDGNDEAVRTAVFGRDALPQLQLRGGKASVRSEQSSAQQAVLGVFGVPPNGGVQLSDVQALLLWLVGDGVAPSWCAVVNKSLVPRVVCLALQGLTLPLLTAHGATCLPFLSSLYRVRTRAPGDGNRINSPIPAILERPLSAKQLRALGVAPQPPTAAAAATVLASAPPGALSEDEYAVRAAAHAISRAILIQHGFPAPLAATDATTTPQDNVCDGYVRAEPRPADGRRAGVRQLVAIDCEMVLCANNKYRLAWLAVTSCSGEVLVDTLVKPDEPILDYLTKYSGVSAEKLAPVTTTLAQAQAMLLAVIDADTYLCGHSLENDLHALGLIHERILDTSLLYPRGTAPSRFQKHALRYLTDKFLKRQIQGGDFHSPSEDAAAAMELTLLKLQRGASFGGDATAPRTTEPLFAAVERAGKKCTMIDRGGLATQYTGATAADAVGCEDDSTALQCTVAAASASGNSSHLIWAQLHTLGEFYDQRVKTTADEIDGVDEGRPSVHGFGSSTLPGEELERTALQHHADLARRLTELDNAARAVYQALPRGAVLIMPTLQGNAAAVKRWHARKRVLAERKLWSAQHDVALERLCLLARDQTVTFLAVRQGDDGAATEASGGEQRNKKLRVSTNDDNDADE